MTLQPGIRWATALLLIGFISPLLPPLLVAGAAWLMPDKVSWQTLQQAFMAGALMAAIGVMPLLWLVKGYRLARLWVVALLACWLWFVSQPSIDVSRCSTSPMINLQVLIKNCREH